MSRFIGSKRIFFLTRYPSKDDLKDGYFQRISAVDGLLARIDRFYVDYSGVTLFPSIKKIKTGVFEIKTSKWNPIGLVRIAWLVLSSDWMYLHSILRLKSIFHRGLFLIARKRIVDLHGAVPEELLLYNEEEKSKIFDEVERFAVKHADAIVSVSNALSKHIKGKYGTDDKEFILLPIFSQKQIEPLEKSFSKEVIYCGGLQKWQQIEKMLKYVYDHKDKYSFTFLVPDLESLKKTYSSIYSQEFPGVVQSVDAEEVGDWYKKSAFGLVLREDIVVNQVACPTKLIEYLQYDIVPIVDFEGIGDFKELGYRFVSYKDELPDEEDWRKMIDQNKIVLERLQEMSQNGSEVLKASLNR